MVLKSAPEIFGKYVTRAIGQPQEYTKNKESGSFPNSYDLRIPQAQAADSVDEDDIAGAMDAVGLSATGKKQPGVGGGRRSYQAATELATSTSSDPMAHAYMPIKALN